MIRYLAALAILILATTTALAMSVITNTTGPYNYTCDDFAKAKPAERRTRVGVRAGYFAALDMNLDVDFPSQPAGAMARTQLVHRAQVHR